MEEIVKKITEIFLKFGIKSVTMDDIARDLCISKKTLYQYFTDKKDVVVKSIEYSIKEQLCKIKNLVFEKRHNAIDILLIVSKELVDSQSKINPNINFDLQKYYPEAWQILVKYRQEHVFANIKQNIERGIEEGYYRNDFNIDVISYLYMNHIENAYTTIIEKSGLNIGEIIQTLFTYHLRGIASAKGLKYIDEQLKNKS